MRRSAIFGTDADVGGDEAGGKVFVQVDHRGDDGLPVELVVVNTQGVASVWMSLAETQGVVDDLNAALAEVGE